MRHGSFKAAAVQMLSFEGEQERNLSRMLARIEEAAAAGARLGGGVRRGGATGFARPIHMVRAGR